MGINFCKFDQKKVTNCKGFLTKFSYFSYFFIDQKSIQSTLSLLRLFQNIKLLLTSNLENVLRLLYKMKSRRWIQLVEHKRNTLAKSIFLLYTLVATDETTDIRDPLEFQLSDMVRTWNWHQSFFDKTCWSICHHMSREQCLLQNRHRFCWI